MAERRMFAKTIIDSDAFLDMPISAQLLYFHLGMRSDDEGFVNKPKTIMRIMNAGDDDMKLLIAKKFIIPFESGIVVIKHWKIHNYIQKDRYTETKYKNERGKLLLDENKAYTMDTECIQSGHELETQVKLGKVSIGKDSEEVSKDTCSTEVQRIIQKWNTLNLQNVLAINSGTKRSIMLHTRIKEYGEDKILKAMDNIKESAFLKGQNKKSWIITFDWFIRPNNFIKVLEGNYIQQEKGNQNGQTSGNLFNDLLSEEGKL